MTFPPITITTGTPLILRPQHFMSPMRKLARLIIYNQPSGADVVWAPVPKPAFTLAGIKPAGGSINLPLWDTTHNELHRGRMGIEAGMVLTDTEGQIDTATHIREVHDNVLVLNKAALGSSLTDLISTPQPISTSNGQPLAQGGQLYFESNNDNDAIMRPLTFLVASGTATVRVTWDEL